jgi:hypothetical protein
MKKNFSIWRGEKKEYSCKDVQVECGQVLFFGYVGFKKKTHPPGFAICYHHLCVFSLCYACDF